MKLFYIFFVVFSLFSMDFSGGFGVAEDSSGASANEGCCADWCSGWLRAWRVHTALRGDTCYQKCHDHRLENIFSPTLGCLYLFLCHDKYSCPCPKCLCEKTCFWNPDATHLSGEKGACCGDFKDGRTLCRGCCWTCCSDPHSWIPLILYERSKEEEY